MHLTHLQEVAAECGEGPVAQDPVRVRADEVGLLRIEVGRLDELGGEEVLEVAQETPILYEPSRQNWEVEGDCTFSNISWQRDGWTDGLSREPEIRYMCGPPCGDLTDAFCPPSRQCPSRRRPKQHTGWEST